MKNFVRSLSAQVAWAIRHDDDCVPGVYATPGPRAQGDEATDEPCLSAELLDEIRISQIIVIHPSDQILSENAPDDGEKLN